MSLPRAARETLTYLFSEYLKGPSVLYDISAIAKKHSLQPAELSDHLLANGWIRDRWVYQSGDVACKITIKGIEEIDAPYVRTKLQKVIGGLGETNGSRQLTDLLEVNISEYSITMDIVKQLDVLGLVRITHPGNTIVVELTELGWRHYEKGSSTFFTLMSY